MSILVYTENWDGEFKKLSFELVSYAAKLAEMLQVPVNVLSIGRVATDELNKLALYGADKVIKAEAPQLENLDNQVFTQIIAEVADQENAAIVLLAHNNTGKALAPRLSIRLKAGLASAVITLPDSVKPFIIKKKVFSGKAFANQVIETERAVLTLAQNSYKLVERHKGIVINDLDVSGDLSPATIVKSTSKQTGQILLSDADIVVSGGRGMKSSDNWGPIEELAEVLGAATACSRPVSDEGWRPHSEHTGQTGKIIAPNLYFAFGISGAIQHLAGVSSSKCIVAVNTDPDAPIFEAADYGIVGDVQKVLPQLVAAIKELKS
ncbi:MAG: electron transfer flavoprotein subunit alpha/FixB family protein [Bacteroidota bacterium]|nr:electron transfer flavoprotein subunit alpha/FixB family protein [Bacteroidota bacterium]